MKKIILTFFLGSLITTSLFAQNLDNSERLFNDPERFLTSIQFDDDKELCSGSFGTIMYREAIGEGIERGKQLSGGTVRKSQLEKDGAGGTETTQSYKNIFHNITNFKCSVLTGYEDRIRKTTLALFFRIPKGDWKNPEVRKLDEETKMSFRKSLYLMQLQNTNISLSIDNLTDWILNNYSNYEGEKIKDADRLMKAIVSGDLVEAKEILDNSEFLNDALKFMEQEGNYL